MSEAIDIFDFSPPYYVYYLYRCSLYHNAQRGSQFKSLKCRGQMAFRGFPDTVTRRRLLAMPRGHITLLP